MSYNPLMNSMPQLQFGQYTSAPNMMAPQQIPELTFGGDFSSTANSSFTGLGQSLGFDMPSFGQAGNQLSNFLSQNGDLLKAGAGLLVGGFGAWNGMNQNKLMKRSLNMQENQFREQMNISKQNINRNLEDRQRARVASNPTAYESVSDYMNKYGVK